MSSGLKAVACLGLLGPLRFDVLPDGLFARSSNGFCEVTVGPETVAPEEFFEFRKFLADDLGAATFEKLNRPGDRDTGWELQQHVDVVGEDGELVNVPTIGAATIIEEGGETLDELALEHLAAVLGHEDDVVQETVGGVAAMPEYDTLFGHAQSVAQWAEGYGSTPALKRGACASGGVKYRILSKIASSL